MCNCSNAFKFHICAVKLLSCTYLYSNFDGKLTWRKFLLMHTLIFRDTSWLKVQLHFVSTNNLTSPHWSLFQEKEEELKREMKIKKSAQVSFHFLNTHALIWQNGVALILLGVFEVLFSSLSSIRRGMQCPCLEVVYSCTLYGSVASQIIYMWKGIRFSISVSYISTLLFPLMVKTIQGNFVSMVESSWTCLWESYWWLADGHRFFLSISRWVIPQINSSSYTLNWHWMSRHWISSLCADLCIWHLTTSRKEFQF